jgi:tRNA(Arg) A34 adenosine deaminase TadA
MITSWVPKRRPSCWQKKGKNELDIFTHIISFIGLNFNQYACSSGCLFFRQEVPVGCVIVLRNALGSNNKHGNSMETENDGVDDGSVIISHGANQVNATRDATRHGELVAIDRMLTGGVASDQLRLTPNVMAKAAHGALPSKYYTLQQHDMGPQHLADVFGDRWINVPANPHHWKNEYGWGTGKIFDKDVFAQCDLYVTCEPCIMVRSLTCRETIIAICITFQSLNNVYVRIQLHCFMNIFCELKVCSGLGSGGYRARVFWMSQRSIWWLWVSHAFTQTRYIAITDTQRVSFHV